MRGLVLTFRNPKMPEPRFWQLFSSIAPDLDRLFWCFEWQPWFGKPDSVDDSIFVDFPRTRDSSIALWRPGSLKIAADYFCEESVFAFGIDPEKLDPKKATQRYHDASFVERSWILEQIASVILRYSDSRSWEVFARNGDLLRRLAKDLRESELVTTVTTEFEE